MFKYSYQQSTNIILLSGCIQQTYFLRFSVIENKHSFNAFLQLLHLTQYMVNIILLTKVVNKVSRCLFFPDINKTRIIEVVLNLNNLFLSVNIVYSFGVSGFSRIILHFLCLCLFGYQLTTGALRRPLV
jgi:hypothetical protein